LLAHGVQPVRVDSPEPIESLLAKLRLALRDGGVPWIAKALRDGDGSRFERMAAEGWHE
jgi:hypothetical protein